jgi:hypothetical protein
MSLAEGVQATIAYKAYASGAMVANTQDQSPGGTGAAYIRRVSSTLNLRKQGYRSNEIRSDRQIVDFRHGPGHVEGDIAGELSPSTYFDFFEAAHRGTRVNGATFTEVDFTSVACSASGSTITFASGNPVTSGMKVGHILNFAGMSVSANNSVHFVVLSFGGTQNRQLTVYPAPTDQSADTAFSVEILGATTSVPASSFVSRKYAFEVHHEDLALSRLFTECRISKYALNMPSTGMNTITVSVMGRDMVPVSASPGQYFTSPTAETSTGVVASVNGLLRLGGTTIGVVTGLSVNFEMPADAPTVVGQNFPPEVFLGTANVTGQMTLFLENTTVLDAFSDETELELLVYLTTSSTAATPGMTVYMPRIKLTGADVNLQGEAGQVITAPFQALRYTGSTAGVPTTTIQIVDTEA